MRKIAILASGTPTAGGSGFEALAKSPLCDKDEFGVKIACVLSNHEHGGVRARAEELGIPFVHFGEPWTGKRCYDLIGEEVDLVCMLGWLKRITGLDPTKTINIHPGPLPEFGGKDMYGLSVHKAVLDAYREGKVSHSAVAMHFVTDEYDKGPVFFQAPVEIREDDTVAALEERVKVAEHWYQWKVTKCVLDGHIFWDGVHPESLVDLE